MKSYGLIQDQDEVDRLFSIFFDFVSVLVDIPESDREHCRQLFKPIAVKQNTLLETAGTVHQYHNFIVSGHMRNFYRDDNQREITTDISDGPRFFTSYYHFMQQSVSHEYLHCITDCELLRISHDDVAVAAQIGITIKEFSEKILQHYLESSKQRAIDLTTLTGKERYLKLIHHHPSIIQHVPLVYIASYLGLNAGSLSRIRQALASD